MAASASSSTSASSTTSTVHSWLAASADDIDCLCLGTGRFLRAVLVPALVNAGFHPALIQTRGRSMLDYVKMTNNNKQKEESTYEIDTVLPDGSMQTSQIPCYGAFTLGSPQGKQAVWNELIPNLAKKKNLRILGVGVTEAGMASPQTQVMKDLYQILQRCQSQDLLPSQHKLCVIDMDNVPQNGHTLKSHMEVLAAEEAENPAIMLDFLNSRVAFLDTMVDRITSQREGSDGMVPRCEPLPSKALVVLDVDQDLPEAFCQLSPHNGVVVRRTAAQLQADLNLKLRVANGTHTAAAHALALCQCLKTDVLSNTSTDSVWMDYLDALFWHDILPAAARLYGTAETQAAYDDWRGRLTHAHFGLSTFFITQNGAAKGGIRLGPTIVGLLQHQQQVSVSMAFALAALLRWLTPNSSQLPSSSSTAEVVYRGWLDQGDRKMAAASDNLGDTYADGLRHNLTDGWYEFRCACVVSPEDGTTSPARPLAEWLAALAATPQQPQAYVPAIRAYLLAPDGGDLGAVASLPSLTTLVQAVATLYARMVAGDSLRTMLEEMVQKRHVYTNQGLGTPCSVLVDGALLRQGGPLPYCVSPIPNESHLMQLPVTRDALPSVVTGEVASTQVIDLHTHLLPPSHGPLCCWGIDELLTYHYLVAEYFITAPASMSPEDFYGMSKKEQANAIWKALFLDRSPVSEACRGVLTTLKQLGLSKEVEERDLEGVRAFYRSYGDQGLPGAEAFSNLVFSMAGVKYAIMTNIPFDSNETQYWRPERKKYPEQYRSALRVDPLLAGDRQSVEFALRSSGYDATLEAARQYLRDWCDTLKPEYMMASTPHDFVLMEGTLPGVTNTSVNEEAMEQPGAFVDAVSGTAACAVNCDGQEDETASVIDENSDLLSEVLMKVCEERDLPVALKIGAHRGVNPRLRTAGDGVVAFADAGVLARLCARFPKVRFLVTFLSRNNQHEACVLASKFRNLHLYGCWWFCNNPSMIEEITKMRVEMLGTAFTAQHSDARVLDQLIYKWSHSRAVIAGVLTKEYEKLEQSGWSLTRAELRRDVYRLFGGSYEEFMAKSFA